ncbi:MAG: TetR/AcrR family transcriptional regulator [Coprococcus sp.]
MNFKKGSLITHGKSRRKQKKKKEALFRTAYELFTTKGINSTAISDIVEKAGVAKGTFYLYFKRQI